MMPLKHILAATDLAEPSMNAVNQSFLLAKISGARFTLTHALGLDALTPLRRLLGQQSDQVSQKLVEDAHQQLQQLVAASEFRDGVEVDILVEQAAPGQAIPELAKRLGTDLVVIGTKSSTLWERMMMGSAGSHLLRKSPCPVLVVKQPPQTVYRRVLVAVDFSLCTELTLRMARTLAPQADLVLLHIYEVPFEGKMQMAGVSEEILQQYRAEARERAHGQLQELVQRLGLTAEGCICLVEQGNPAAQIVQLAQKHQCDMIAIGKHGTSMSEELLLGSIAKQVVAEAPMDVLVVVDKTRPETPHLIPQPE